MAPAMTFQLAIKVRKEIEGYLRRYRRAKRAEEKIGGSLSIFNGNQLESINKLQCLYAATFRQSILNKECTETLYAISLWSTGNGVLN